ncbi:MAG: DUF2079 domain-containing protein [Promethearchaeota archaeon]
MSWTQINSLYQCQRKKGFIALCAIFINIIGLWLYLVLIGEELFQLDKGMSIWGLFLVSSFTLITLALASSLLYAKKKRMSYLEACYKDGFSYLSGLVLVLYIPILLYGAGHSAFPRSILIFILSTWLMCTVCLKLIMFTPTSRLEKLGVIVRQKIKWIFAGCIGIYVICLFYLGLRKYLVFGGYGYDNAGFYRFFLNASKGLWFHEVIDGGYLLSWHIDFMLYPFAALFSILPDINTFLLIKTVMIGISGIPLYLIIKEDHHPISVLLIVFSYLLFHQIAGTSLLDFHEVILAPFFLLFTFYFYRQEKFGLFSLFMVLSLSIKENIPFVIIPFFVYGLIMKRSKKWILTPLIAGGVWLFVSVKILLPYFGCKLHIHPECIRNILGCLRQPYNIVKILSKPRIVGLIYTFFQPFLFIFPFVCREILFVIPWLLLVIFEGRNPQIRTWHFLIIVGFVFIAYSSTLVKIKEWFKSERVTIFIATIVFFVNISCFPYWFRSEELIAKPYINAQRRTIGLIPKSASVCAPEYMLSQLADRRKIYSEVGFREELSEDIDFIIFDSHISRYLIEHLELDITPKFIEELRELAPAGRDYMGYRLYWEEDGIYVYANKGYEGFGQK